MNSLLVRLLMLFAKISAYYPFIFINRFPVASARIETTEAKGTIGHLP